MRTRTLFYRALTIVILVALLLSQGATTLAEPTSPDVFSDNPRVAAASIPFSDDFSTDKGWTNQTSEHFYRDTTNEWLSWHIHRSTDEKYYIPITPYSGDFRLEAKVKATYWANNCNFYFGLADSLTGERPTGLFVDFGWFGGFAERRFIRPVGFYSDTSPYRGDRITYNMDEWYRVVFEVVGLNWTVTVYDESENMTDQKTGTFPAVHDSFNYITLWSPDNGDWPTGDGLFDNLVVESVGGPGPTPTPTPTRGVILFTHGSDHGTSDTEIYKINPDGSNLTRLTNNSWADSCPRISPDGRKVAFRPKQSGSPALYTMDVDGENVILISDKAGGCPYAWSPNGTRIAFNANLDGSGTKLYTVEIATGHISAIPSVAGDHRFDWSPDGTKLAVINDPWALYAQNIDGTNRQLISSLQPRMPVWNPTSNRIVYEQYMGRLRIINADGTNDTFIPTAELAFNPHWSPDGTQIVYSTLWAGQLRIINADGTNDHSVPNVPSGWIDWVDWGKSEPPNTLPTADAGGPYTANEGDTVTLDASGSSDPDDNIILYEWDLDNDSQYDDALGVTTEIAFEDNGIFTMGLRVTDEFDESDTDTAEVTVLNIAPTVDAGAGARINEGDTFSGSGSFADPGADTWIAIVDYGDGSGVQPLPLTGNTFALSHTYADNGDYTIEVCVTDDDDGTGCDSLTVTVLNVAPTVGAIIAPVDPVEVKTAINASVEFTDPGVLDTHTAVWDWGDDSTSVGTVNEMGGSGSVTGSHTYITPGVYTVRLMLTDDDGDSDESIFQYIAIYDPEGGFVTGGGWINSPEGAYAPDPSLAGKANFGFVSKYKKGADIPTGATEFQFKVANLNFHSDTYQWLVVAGPKAQFKGTGTINGAGNYGFMLTAVDAALTPSTEVDKFRIKIWDKDNGDAIVYDNQMWAGDDADPVSAIGGGSIVIHKAK